MKQLKIPGNLPGNIFYAKIPGRVGSAGQQTAAAAFFATKRQQQHQQQGLLVKPGVALAKLQPDTQQPSEKRKETVSFKENPSCISYNNISFLHILSEQQYAYPSCISNPCPSSRFATSLESWLDVLPHLQQAS